MTEPVQEAPQPTNLTLNDLLVMYSIIQATAQRGAIKAEEMSITGALHDKLKQFLIENGATLPGGKPSENPAAQPVETK